MTPAKEAELLIAQGIKVRCCSSGDIQEFLDSHQGKMQVGLFGATYCDACTPTVRELIAFRTSHPEADFYYFPVETIAPAGLDPKQNLDKVISHFKECTNGHLFKASGWEAAAIPVFVLSGRKDGTVWMQTGYLPQEVMEEMIGAYRQGGTYEEFTIKKLPHKVAILEKKMEEVLARNGREYTDWYPFWTALERSLLFIRDHMPIRQETMTASSDGKVRLPVRPKKAPDAALVKVSLTKEELESFVEAGRKACSITETVVNKMREIALADEGNSLEESKEPYYEKKLNLPRVVRNKLDNELYDNTKGMGRRQEYRHPK